MRAMNMGVHMGKRRGSPWPIARRDGTIDYRDRDPHRNLMRLLERWTGRKSRKAGVGKRYKGRRRETIAPFPIFNPWELVHGGPIAIKRHLDDVKNFYSNLKG